MFGSSAALKKVELENAQLRLELDKLTKLVEALTENAVTEQDISGIVGDAVKEAFDNFDFDREVESAVENALENATITVRF